MSLFVSPAQALPFNILRRVIQYSKARTKECHVYTNITSVMLSVCSSWRLTALENIWKELHLNIASCDKAILVDIPMYVTQSNLPNNVSGFVRKLDIYVSMSSILNGTAYKLLSEYMKDTTSLPVASKLVIRISVGELDTEYLMASANVLEFSELLKSLTPAETTTTVTYANELQELSIFEEECFGKFTNLLCDRSSHVTLSMEYAELMHKPTIDLIPQVSSLTTVCQNALDLNTMLVHRCASTLLELDIKISCAKTLFYDANENIIIYPKLKVLRLAPATDYAFIESASVPNVVTLPSLIDLAMPMTFPFEDDVLFRGNNRVLKSLIIPMDKNAVHVLKSNRVLGDQSKDMKVTINQSYHNDALSLVSEDDINLFIGNLVGAAQTLELYSNKPVKYLIAAAPPIRGFEQLRELSITKVRLTFFGVLSLLKVLPNIAKLGCGFKGLGSELGGISSEELPDHIASTYSNTGRNLQVVSNIWFSGRVRPVVPKYFLLLALACPKLRQIKLQLDAITDFQANVAEALQSDPYIKYASQLNRLIHATYEACDGYPQGRDL